MERSWGIFVKNICLYIANSGILILTRSTLTKLEKNREISNANKYYQYLEKENREDICIATDGNWFLNLYLINI